MVDFNQAIQLIRDNGGFKPNANDSSYYRVYTTQGNKPIQVRVSNHGTHLWTWYGKEYDPSISINICVAFSQNGECNSNINVDMRILDNQGTVVGEKKQFEVVQYTYNCSLLDKQDIGYINQAILNIWKNNGFSDPFNGTDKAATKQVLHPVANNKQEIKENKKMNKKQVIKINENQLKQIVTETVKKVLKEDNNIASQERMYNIIANLESDMKTVISNTDTSSGQAFGSPEEKLHAISNALSHVDNGLSQQAKLTFDKLIEVISELQDLRIQLKTLNANDSYWGHRFKTPNGTVGLSNYN